MLEAEEQIFNVSVPHDKEELAQSIQLVPQERIQQRTMKLVDSVAALERNQQRTVEEVVDVLVSHIMKAIFEAVEVPLPNVMKDIVETVEQFVDVPVPRIMKRGTCGAEHHGAASHHEAGAHFF